MAWFRCMVGAGNALELIVTCSSQFAGQTITCTDGISTLTATCPSSSPYEITFKLTDYGTWTVSGTTGGQSYSESIVVQPYEVELMAQVDITVDVYSAANDTVSYTGLDGQAHTITTDSSGHASASITVIASGSSLTFTSSVAKNPNDLSQYYSKAVTLDSTTTALYVMPVDDALYWYGYKGSKLESCNTSNGWTGYNGGWTDPTYNTNYVSLNANVKNAGIGSKIKVPINSLHAIARRTNTLTYSGVFTYNTKNVGTGSAGYHADYGSQNTIVYAHANADGGDYYLISWEYNSGTSDVFALWNE